MMGTYWELKLEYTESTGRPAGSPAFGYATIQATIPAFAGSKKITNLAAYPLKFHPEAEEIRTKLVERGKKWASLKDCHHMRYDGVAYTGNIRNDKVKVSRLI